MMWEPKSTNSATSFPFQCFSRKSSLVNEVTPNYFFTYIYPQMMVVDGHEQDCAAFIDFFRATITRFVIGVDTSAVHRSLPVAPPRNKVPLEYRRQVIMHHFPLRNANLAQIQRSQIATQLGAIVQQQNDFKVEGDACRIAKEVMLTQKIPRGYPSQYLAPNLSNPNRNRHRSYLEAMGQLQTEKSSHHSTECNQSGHDGRA